MEQVVLRYLDEKDTEIKELKNDIRELKTNLKNEVESRDAYRKQGADLAVDKDRLFHHIFEKESYHLKTLKVEIQKFEDMQEHNYHIETIIDDYPMIDKGIVKGAIFLAILKTQKLDLVVGSEDDLPF